MAHRPPAVPGGSIAPILSSSFHNEVEALLTSVKGESNSSPDRPQGERQFLRLSVYNSTSKDVPSGGVLGFDEMLYGAEDNEENFAFEDIIFEGVDIDESKHTNRFVVLLEECNAGQTADCYVPGWIQARVDVTNEDHTFAKVVSGDLEKMVSDGGKGVAMIPAQSGTGEMWALIRMGGGATSTDAPNLAYVFTGIDGADNDLEVTFTGPSTVDSTGELKLGGPSDATRDPDEKPNAVALVRKYITAPNPHVDDWDLIYHVDDEDPQLLFVNTFVSGDTRAGKVIRYKEVAAEGEGSTRELVVVEDCS